MNTLYRHLFSMAVLVLGAAAGQQPDNGSSATPVPRLLHFAGTLHSPAMPQSGLVGATFSIYDEQEGGSALWSEDQNVKVDGNGNYTVMLGATKNGGVPLELFAAGETRWLQVKFVLTGESEQARVPMVSVPYALKALDSETVGGLPASAFVLAAPVANATAGTTTVHPALTSPSPLVSGTGTTDFVPLWMNSSGALGNSVLFQSGTGITAKVGVNTTTPAATLDIGGGATVRGLLSLTASGTANVSAGKSSEPLSLAASVFNSGTSAAQAETFRLQAEPKGNDTASPSGTLNLLFGSGSSMATETGLSIANTGKITFASGQTFPGTGTITGVTAGSGLSGGGLTGNVTLGLTKSCANGQILQWSGTAWVCASVGLGGITGVTAGTDLTGGGTSGNITLNVDTSKIPRLNSANTFSADQTVNGNSTSTGAVSGGSFQLGNSLFAYGSASGYDVYLGFNTGTNNPVNSQENVGIGVYALSNNDGWFNTAVGVFTLQENINGSYNTSLGFAALTANTSGLNNTAVGSKTLGQNTTGNGNTAVGANALFYAIGNNNTALGYSAGPSSASGFINTTALGANSYVSESNALILGGTGNNAVSVGIGTGTPYFDYALDVEATPGGPINGGVVVNATGGNMYLGMVNGVHQFRVDTNGLTYSNGGFQSSGADFAESFAVRGPRSRYSPGDVMEIDPKADRNLTLSHHAYGTLVAGIYSTKPGLLASPHDIDDPAVKSSEVPLAVIGIVPCKVTAENGAISRGDLLVTSSRPGYAMKGTNRRRMLGAVLGKALEPLPKGTGVIQVLVTLQ